MHATLALFINGQRRTSETRALAMPRFLRETVDVHIALMARLGITAKPAITVRRGAQTGTRLVVIESGPLRSVVALHRAPGPVLEQPTPAKHPQAGTRTMFEALQMARELGLAVSRPHTTVRGRH
jgi:hypothetical protein